MSLEYVNRRGDRYYVFQGRTKTGKPKYFCALREPAVGARVERWCYLGSIDRWIFLEASKHLDDLARTYSPHLGQESFFELM